MPKKWTDEDLKGLNVTGDTGKTQNPIPGISKPKHGTSDYSQELTIQTLVSLGLPDPDTEYKFHPDRKWRFDYAWPDYRMALEVEGGIYTGGAHGSISGKIRDIEKYNAARAMGWHILQALPKWLPGTSINGTLANQLIAMFIAKEKQLTRTGRVWHL